MGCQVFKRGIQNWITHRKEIIEFLRIGLMGMCQKVPKFDFQS